MPNTAHLTLEEIRRRMDQPLTDIGFALEAVEATDGEDHGILNLLRERTESMARLLWEMEMDSMTDHARKAWRQGVYVHLSHLPAATAVLACTVGCPEPKAPSIHGDAEGPPSWRWAVYSIDASTTALSEWWGCPPAEDPTED